jgi:hypothetical protein
MFVPHRKHRYGSALPVTGIALLSYFPSQEANINQGKKLSLPELFVSIGLNGGTFPKTLWLVIIAVRPSNLSAS